MEETEEKDLKHGKQQTTQQTETAKEETSDQELKELKEVKGLLVKLGGWFDSDLRKKIKPIPGLATTHCVPDKK